MIKEALIELWEVLKEVLSFLLALGGLISALVIALFVLFAPIILSYVSKDCMWLLLYVSYFLALYMVVKVFFV